MHIFYRNTSSYSQDQLQSPDLSLLMEAQRLSSSAASVHHHTNIFHQTNVGKFPNLGLPAAAGSSGSTGGSTGSTLPPPEYVPASPIVGGITKSRHFADATGGYTSGTTELKGSGRKTGSRTYKKKKDVGSIASDSLVRTSLDSIDSNSSSSSIANINSLNSSIESMDRLLSNSNSTGKLRSSCVCVGAGCVYVRCLLDVV